MTNQHEIFKMIIVYNTIKVKYIYSKYKFNVGDKYEVSYKIK